MRKTLTKIIYGISTLANAWFILSWLEIIIKNGTTNPQYSPLNLFELLF